ncbi:MAG TPA: ABC transporter permease [Candidatus Acidoferrales bacterium]|jgi:ABC-2 type transport system permease protein|nr:ABC transporter permease [Candidatus Acidoferrales bacterium]
MRVFWTLFRRELASFFLSITGYVIIAAVTLLIGLGFVVLITNLGSDSSPMPLTELFYGTFFFWVVVLLIAPVITMRLFALEKFTGTFETLMTTPVGDFQVVAAKFAAAVVFYMVTWLPMLACLFVIRHYTDQPNTLDAGMIGGMYLGIFMIGSLFLSLGCFASSLTKSQMAAAIVSFVLGVSLFSVGFLADAIETPTQWQSQVLSCFGLFKQMDDFARGVVDLRTVIFYASLTFFFLFLTLRVVESRRWK